MVEVITGLLAGEDSFGRLTDSGVLLDVGVGTEDSTVVAESAALNFSELSLGSEKRKHQIYNSN